MKQVRVVGPRRVVVEDVAAPEAQPGEALLRIQYVGICGSDVHTYTGSNPLGVCPLVPGHELSAHVEKVAAPDAEIEVGDLVVLEPLVRCARCYPCKQGRYNCCENLRVMGVSIDGGMREMLSAPVALLHRAPACVSPRIAALTEPVTIGYQAITRGRVSRDDTLVVIGAGPIGMLTALIGKSLGATVGMWDIKDVRLKRAERLGVDFVVNPDRGDAIERTVAALGARPSVVIEAVGIAQTIRAAIDLVRAAGRVVVIGVSPQDVQFPEVQLIRKELDLLGTRNSCHMFPRALEFVRGHQDKLSRLITHEFPLVEAERGIQTMMNQDEDVVKVLLAVG